MGSTEDEALSDLEDDAAPIVLPASSGAVSNPEGLKSVLAELEAERQARKAAEVAKADLLTRLKNATRQRDEAVKQKEEAHVAKEDLAKQLTEALHRRDEALRQRDEIAQQRDEAIKLKDEFSRLRDEASKSRDSTRSEIEAAARLLVAGAERILSKASSVKSFPGNLPRSTSHTGVAAIAYGYSKRAEDIVDELVRQHELAVKNRSEMRQQMEQRNYEIAIEVSELEASIQSLKDELSKKSSEVEKWQSLTHAKDDRISEIEKGMSQKLTQAQKEIEVLKKAAQEAQNKLNKMKDSTLELSHLIFKANETLSSIAVSFSISQTDSSKRTASSSIHNEPEEGLQDCISRFKELIDLCLRLGSSWKEHRELRKKELDELHGTITKLVAEKKEIASFLRSALANKQDISINNHGSNIEKKSLNTKHDNSEHIGERNLLGSRMEETFDDDLKIGEAISMASELENEVRNLRQEMFELQQLLATARGEVEWLRVTSEQQANELSLKSVQLEELSEKESLAEDKIENLNFALAGAQEEILRWKQAATKEAEAGAAVLEEVERCQEEISTLRKQVEQLRLSLEESNSKLRSKEEMATAAIAAQKAAERSLRIADERAVELRERIEELTRQFDALESRGDSGIATGLFNMCWPYQWFRGTPLFLQRTSTPPHPEAEMEQLLEPLV